MTFLQRIKNIGSEIKTSVNTVVNDVAKKVDNIFTEDNIEVKSESVFGDKKADSTEVGLTVEHVEQGEPSSDDIVNELYKEIYAFKRNDNNFDNQLNSINQNNVVDILQKYSEKSPNESLIEAIFDEVTLDSDKKAEYINHIKDALITKASEYGAGVEVATEKFSKEFDKITSSLLTNVGYYKTKDLDKIINEFLNTIDQMQVLKDAAEERYNAEEGKVYSSSENQMLFKKYFGEDAYGNSRIESDNRARQLTGNCWAHAGINALVATPQGRDLINNLITKTDGVIAVKLPEAEQKGLPKPKGDGIYTVTEAEIAEAMDPRNKDKSQSGGDGDVTAVMVAISKYFDETGEHSDFENNMDGNHSTRMFQILTGKKNNDIYSIVDVDKNEIERQGKERPYFKLSNVILSGISVFLVPKGSPFGPDPETINIESYSYIYNSLEKLLANNEGAITISFGFNSNSDNVNSVVQNHLGEEISDKKAFISNNHEYAVTKMDDEYVYLVESNNPNVIIKIDKDSFIRNVCSISVLKFD